MKGPVKLIAIKECPNQLPGSVFDVPDELAQVFIELGAAKPYEEPPPAPPSRRNYRRRDLKAEDSDT